MPEKLTLHVTVSDDEAFNHRSDAVFIEAFSHVVPQEGTDLFVREEPDRVKVE